MNKPIILAVFISFTILFNCSERNKNIDNYDVVILNGHVIDPETKFNGIRNVGIKDGVIAIITDKEIQGEEIIDATGHIVSPGFIETHNHWSRPLGYKLNLRDGVTTCMDLEGGVFGPRVNEWYKMHEGQSQVNYGTGSGHEFARNYVTSGYEGFDVPQSIVEGRSQGTAWAEEVLSLEKGNKMLRAIDQGLADGALGVASTVGYFPGATAREMFEVQRIGGRYGRLTATHNRFTPGTNTTEVLGVQELLSNGTALGSPVMINHYNNPGWEMVQELLVLYREQGLNVWGEIYPYAAGSTTINAAFIKPEVWVDELGNAYEETMQDPVSLEFYTQETYKKELASNPTKQVLLYKISPDVIPNWIKLPGVIVASDGMPAIPGTWEEDNWDMAYEDIPNGHPRLAGTRGTCLRLARQENISMMHMVSILSYNAAKYLGDAGLEAMKKRGRLQEGMIADITIFNPNTVTDNATYEKGTLPTTGIPYVIVNGVVVVKNSMVLKDVNPGQPIRFPKTEAKFKAVSAYQWETNFLINPNSDFHAFDDCLDPMH